MEAPGGHHEEGGSPLLDVSIHGWIKPASPGSTSLEGPICCPEALREGLRTNEANRLFQPSRIRTAII